MFPRNPFQNNIGIHKSDNSSSALDQKGITIMQANAANGIPHIKFSDSSESDKEESIVRINKYINYFIFIQIEENSN